MFSDEEKAIFSFSDGRRDRKVDPMAVRRALVRAAGGDLYGLGMRMAGPFSKKPDEDTATFLARLDAQEEMAGVIRTAFNLPAINEETGEGIPEDVCWRVWKEWNEWLAGESTGDGSLATGQQSTAGQPPVPSVTPTSSPLPSTAAASGPGASSSSARPLSSSKSA